MLVNGRKIGPGEPVYIIAEMSANHNQSYDQAVKILHAAKEAGADAVKLQTYTPDTITIACNNPYFQINSGTIWDGTTLHELYKQAYTPWDWQPKLKQLADELEIDCFSSPFDFTAVDFLEEMNVPAYKIASFENIDFPLIKKVAETGKPIIMSTGMASLSEVGEAVETARDAGCKQLALLKCVSAYPSPPEVMNLKTIPHLAETFKVPAGLSDHTLGTAVPVTSVALGACIIEKHFTLSRSIPGPDSTFSLEPDEFRQMVDAVRVAEKAVGSVSYGTKENEKSSKVYRRSLFVVKEMKQGDVFTEDNVRSIRPAYGLHTRYYEEVLGKKSRCDIELGTPLSWDLIG